MMASLNLFEWLRLPINPYPFIPLKQRGDNLISAIVYLIVLSAGFALIYFAGRAFVDSSCAIASKLGVSRHAIGLTIVSLATTAPEFVTSTTASVLGNVGVAYGNAVGSAICNIALILAIAALIGAISVERGRMGECASMLGLGALVSLMALDGELSHFEGMILLISMAMILGLIVRREARGRDRRLGSGRTGLGRPSLIFVLGGLGVVVGSRALIYSGVGIAGLLGIPEAVIGFTLISIGTSLPELATAIISSLKKVPELSLGNIIGANILDITWVLGVSALIRPLPIDHQTMAFNNPMMLIVMGALLLFMLTRRRLTRGEGAVLLGMYVLYLAGICAFY